MYCSTQIIISCHLISHHFQKHYKQGFSNGILMVNFLYMYSSHVWPKIFCQHFYMTLLTRVAADQVLIDNSKEIPFTRCTPLTLTIIPISFHILTTHILHFYGLIYLISCETAYLKNWVPQVHVEYLHIYSYDIMICYLTKMIIVVRFIQWIFVYLRLILCWNVMMIWIAVSFYRTPWPR